MKRLSRFSKVTGIFLALTMFLAGCGGSGRSTTPNTSGETKTDQKPVVILQGVDPSTLDPANHTETAATNILSNIYDTLVDRNEKMEFIPGLAENWKAVNDTTWEFVLRKGVKFSDGTDLTADDVKFSLERIKRDGMKRASYLAPVKEVKVLEPLKFQVITNAPYPVLPNRLSEEHILSKKYVESKGEDAAIKNPMGTGPYKFVKWVKDEQLELVANDAHWRGAPTIKQVIFKPVSEAQTRISQLLAGQADVIVNVPANQIDNVKNSGKSAVAEVPSGRVVYVDVNSKAGITANAKVRQAMAAAVDMDAIIKNVLLGNGFKVNSALTPQHFGYVESAPGLKYDLDNAKKLLAESGYKGEEIMFDTPSGRYAMDKEIAEAVTAMLQKAGFKIKLQVNEWGNHSKMANAHTATGLFLLGWGNNTWDADGTIEPEFGSKGAVTLTNDADLDKLIYGAREILDQTRRADLYKQAQDRITNQAYHIANWRQKDVYGVSTRINFTPRPDERLWMFSAKLK